MEIAKGIRNTEWHGLDLETPDSEDWAKAILIFRKRISERYIEAADKLIELEANLSAIEKKYGFVVLAIDCMLIETLQSFYEGLTDTAHKSLKMFENFLTQTASFSKYFTSKSLAKQFYLNYRCGILHQSETQEGALVWSFGQLLRIDGADLTINRLSFHSALKQEFEIYINILKDPTKQIERTNFKTKMDFISRKIK